MFKTILALALLIPATQQPQTFSVGGTVKFDGPVPKPKANKQLEGDPACCALHTAIPPKDDLVVSPSGGVRWAFVYVKKGLEGKTFQPPAAPVVIDQVGCVYTPHVAGVMAGQPVHFTNSDPVLHNVNIMTFANKGMNFGQIKGAVTPVTFQNPEVMIKTACNVHPFMSSHIGVMAHPFFAVTDAEGKFEIKNLPAGTYTLAVWHERLQKEEREIVVKGATAESFALKQ
jgi:plastocyanin